MPSRISVDHEVIFFFPSRDKPRGDTISMSRYLKAVINSGMDVFFFYNLLLLPLWNCVVCTLKWAIMLLGKKWAYWLQDKEVGKDLQSSFVRLNVTDLQILSEPRLWSSVCSDRRNAKFWKGVYKFLSCAPLRFHLIFNMQKKKSSLPLLLLTTRFPCAT